ncbi:transmembrane protein [Medicago truncatula]|uniref:Transmembrane protein n=1 Tax=Medicago truncatula TaxID=3880 RepID=G7J5U4_MEDTR|nr:transmembrane protein [Medicago truncatula]
MRFIHFTEIIKKPAGGGSSKERDVEDSLSSKSNVNSEYRNAFRTKSYVDICNKAQGYGIENTSMRSSHSNSCSTSSSSLLEPRQEIVTNMIKSFKVHHLLVDYFEASLEAYLCCDKILQGVRQTRFGYGKVINVVNKLSQRVVEYDTDTDVDTNVNDNIIYEELVSSVINNSLCLSNNIINFCDIQEKHIALLNRLNSKRLKLKRRITIKRLCKKVGGIGLVVSETALLVALLVFAFHSIIGLAAAPYVVGGSFGLMKKRSKWENKKYNSCEKLYEQIDVAAKGVYIVINDLDTMSRMVKRLADEVEHCREVADICVKNYGHGNGRCVILKMVLREFRDCQTNFMDQLEELEEHIYLCFLAINRSRRQLMQKITDKKY